MSKAKKALKKPVTVKSKTVAAKAPAKPAAKKVVKAAAVKAAPAKGKPAPKAPVKTAASKVPAKAPAPVKKSAAPVKPAAKAPAAAPAPAAKAKAPAAKTASPAASAPAKAPAKAAATAPVQNSASAKKEAPADDVKPAAAKAKKARADETPSEPEEEVVLLDAEGRRYCRVRECDQASAVDGYCRYHYLLYWKNIQVRKKILSEGKLERYIEELTARYPDKYLEMLKKDLRTEKDFLAAIQELEIDESSVDNEYEDEAQNYLDEVRGMSSESGGGERDEEF